MKGLRHLLIKNPSDTQSNIYENDKKQYQWTKFQGEYSKNDGALNFLNLITRWPLIVGEKLSTCSVPLKLKNEVLFVMIAHPIFGQELQFQFFDIQKKVSNDFKSQTFKFKKFRFINNEDFFKDKFQNIVRPNNDKINQVNLAKPLKPIDHPFNPKRLYLQNLFISQLHQEGISELDLETTNLLTSLFIQKSTT